MPIIIIFLKLRFTAGLLYLNAFVFSIALNARAMSVFSVAVSHLLESGDGLQVQVRSRVN